MDILKNLKIRQYEIAEKLGISKQLLSIYLNHKVKHVSISLLKGMFFMTNGKLTPNILLDVVSWKDELKQLKVRRRQ
jgi:transcriptional regulator with XRE-family HTH domain